MKKLKTLISVVLSAMLVLSLVVPSMAASDFVITVEKDKVAVGETYTAHKIFDVVYTGSGTSAKGVYTATPEQKAWIEANITDDAGVDFDGSTDIDGNFYVTMSTATADEFAKQLNKKYDEMTDKTAFTNLFPVKASAKLTSGNSVALDVGEAGYYFVTTTSGSLCNLNSATPSVTIKDKNDVVTVDKILTTDDVNPNTQNKENDAQIGDTVTFETTVKIPKNSKDVVLYDKMDAGFTFGGAVVVKVGSKTLVAGTDYTFDGTATADYTFKVTFAKAYLDGLQEEAEVKVTYSAVLNEDAQIVDQGITNNETWVKFGANQETSHSITTTKTTYFNLFKFYYGDDQEMIGLAGAEFQLHRGTATGAVVEFVKDTNGDYRVADANDTGKVNKIVSTEEVIKIYGLDIDDSYFLVETKAPTGFNKLQSSIEVNNTKMTTQIDVENNQGALLPTTGGMGTKVLFTVGGIMMVVAFVLFTSKRRMAAED